jgi:cation transport regulator ChaC
VSSFAQTLAESRKRWKPDSRVERMAQVIAAAHGYSTAAACRQYEDAALEALALSRDFYLPK